MVAIFMMSWLTQHATAKAESFDRLCLSDVERCVPGASHGPLQNAPSLEHSVAAAMRRASS